MRGFIYAARRGIVAQPVTEIVSGFDQHPASTLDFAAAFSTTPRFVRWLCFHFAKKRDRSFLRITDIDALQLATHEIKDSRFIRIYIFQIHNFAFTAENNFNENRNV